MIASDQLVSLTFEPESMIGCCCLEEIQELEQLQQQEEEIYSDNSSQQNYQNISSYQNNNNNKNNQNNNIDNNANTLQQQIDKLVLQYQEMVSEECLILFKEQQKSNYLKNLIRSFNRFVLNEGDSVIIECLDVYQKQCAQFRQQYKKFIKRRNINNSLIKDLIMNERFEVYAVDWLKQSVKIIDISYHIFYIVYLIRSFTDSSLLEMIKFYSK